MDDIDLNEDNDCSSVQIFNTKSYIDNVYLYSGQSFGRGENEVLKALNELSANNCMLLEQRQLANRDVRILLPNQTPQPEKTTLKPSKTRKTSDCSRTNDDYNEIPTHYTSSHHQNSKNVDDLSDEELHDKSYSHTMRHIENKNYNTFLYNFNKLAVACYLKTMRAHRSLWAHYLIDAHFESETDFFTVKKTNDQQISQCLNNDQEFVKNYVDLMVNMHQKIVNKLYKVLNTPMIRVHFNNSNRENQKSSEFSNSKKNGESHLFRSFRILGLRQQKTKLKKKQYPNFNSNTSCQNCPHCLHQATNRNFLVNNQFHEVVDIRTAFDVRQFQNKTGYDCFIECEMTYFKINYDQFYQLQQKQQQTFNYSCSQCSQLNRNRNVNVNQSNNQSSYNEKNYQFLSKNQFLVGNHNILNYLNRSLANANNLAFKYTDNDLMKICEQNRKLKNRMNHKVN